MKWIDDRTIRFLLKSLACAVALCVAVFGFLAYYMNGQSIDTITSVGAMYMSTLSDRITGHFQTLLDLRLSQLDAVATIAGEAESSGQEVRDALAQAASLRSFSHLCLLCADGSMDVLCGDAPDIAESEAQSFVQSLMDGERKMALGHDANGDVVALLGVPLAFPTAYGEDSIALVAGVRMDYFRNRLELEADGMKAYSHIIRKDGYFIVRSGNDTDASNYFDWVRTMFFQQDGEDPDAYVDALQEKIEQREVYSGVMMVHGVRRWIYCTPLPESEWYLITVMPFTVLNGYIHHLSGQWTFMALIGCGTILAALLVIFFLYAKRTGRQIHELKQARSEAQLASRAKSEFLSNMSHDIRTPMNIIVGMAAIAMANLQNSAQVQNCLRKITLAGRHLLGLINNVLDMSKIESGKMTLNIDRVSLREVMDNIVSIVQPQIHAKKQRFDVRIERVDTENVYCDGVRLNQVIMNLVSNAIKFTPDGGTIEIRLYEEPSPKGDDYARVHLIVKDNGIGMTKEFREVVFETFAREDSARVHRTEGSGLGMAITKYIVDAMEGTIDVESEPGAGTEFHVTLDLEKCTIDEEDMELPPWQMLVVDDDELLCESTVNALKSIGVQADWVLDGESAVEAARRKAEEGEGYHIILLDWKLPRMDGIATAKCIRHELKIGVPILLISAYDWNEIEEEAREAGVNGFIAKPLFKSTLYYGLKPFAGIEHSEDAPLVDRISFNGMPVLLAEDNELNWEVASELLSEMDLAPEWAENGRICLEKFQNSPEGYYGAILMDVRMPEMNGYEATRAIRALNRSDAKRIPIIAMTADAFSEDARKCIESGMDAHVAKPIDVQRIAQLIREFMVRP